MQLNDFGTILLVIAQDCLSLTKLILYQDLYYANREKISKDRFDPELLPFVDKP
jgi:hypothetical protein